MAATLKKEEEKILQGTGALQKTTGLPAYQQAQIQQQQNSNVAPLVDLVKAQQAQQAQTQAQQATPYSGLQGVSKNTAQQLGNMQAGYNPSETVTAAQQALQSLQDTRPGAYNSRYNAQLEQILQKITNPEQFKYSFNGDELFKQLSDRYVQQGKQAMMDTMGQASMNTGGYGNSYAQMAGQQTYDQYLQGLYDKGLDLYDRAWNRYQAGQDQLMDQFGVLSQADQQDYARYRDTVGDWENERNYLTGRADTEYERDYNQYMNQLNYWTQLAGAENADWNTQQQMAEQKRQWDAQFEYNKMSDAKKYAYDICTAILANGKMPSQTQLKAAGISEADAKKMKAQAKTGGGRGGSNGGGGPSVYEGANGKLYTINEKGLPVEVNFNDVPDNSMIYRGPEAHNILSNAVSTAWNNNIKDIKETFSWDNLMKKNK